MATQDSATVLENMFRENACKKENFLSNFRRNILKTNFLKRIYNFLQKFAEPIKLVKG
jgi:hypothetical protein